MTSFSRIPAVALLVQVACFLLLGRSNAEITSATTSANTAATTAIIMDGTNLKPKAQLRSSSSLLKNNAEDAPLKKRRELAAAATDNAQSSWVQMGDDLKGTAQGDQSGSSVSMSYDGTRIAVGSTLRDMTDRQDAGHVRVYQWSETAQQWSPLGNELFGTASDAQFGYSVSLSGDGKRLAVGWLVEPPYGKVQMYQYDGTSNQWKNMTAVPLQGEVGSHFGASISMSETGDRVAIGAPMHGGSMRGQVRIFEYNTTHYVQKGKAMDGYANGFYFGQSVSLTGNGRIVAVGAPKANNFRGNVTIYQQVTSTSDWTRLGTSSILGDQDNEESGTSVALMSYGLTNQQYNLKIIIGSPLYDVPVQGQNAISDAGRVRSFLLNKQTMNWLPDGPEIIAGSNDLKPVAGQQFGRSVAISATGFYIAVGGAYAGKDASVGHYHYSDEEWTGWNITALGSASSSGMGNAIALSSTGNRLVVGSPGANANGVESGKTQVYQHENAIWDLTFIDVDSQFGEGDAPQFTITLEGRGPDTSTARTFTVEMLDRLTCAVPTADDAVKPVAASGTIPADTKEFTITPQLRVDYSKLGSSPYFTDYNNGFGNLAFCVRVAVMEGTEARTFKKISMNLDIYLGTDFTATFVPGGPIRQPTSVTFSESIDVDFTLDTYMCDESGERLVSSIPVMPGDMVHVCLEPATAGAAIVGNVLSVSFKNSEAPLLGVDLINDAGVVMNTDTSAKKCDLKPGMCMVSAMTEPRLYEYIDDNGRPVDVSSGVYMSGTVIFQFPKGRRLQDGTTKTDASEGEVVFNVNINLATPPDRSNRYSSGGASSFLLSVAVIAASIMLSTAVLVL